MANDSAVVVRLGADVNIQPPPKACARCRFYAFGLYAPYPVCTSKLTASWSDVFGWRNAPCHEARSDEESCGPKARYYAPLPAPRPGLFARLRSWVNAR